MKLVEITVGIFVAAGIVALFMLAMKVSNLSTFNIDHGYQLTARFDNIGGLKVQSPVNAAGVQIGRVISIQYDQNTFEAEVRMVIASQYNHLPEDTSASIYTAGLLGEQYIGLEPGGEMAYLKDGDEIKYTQSALVMEQLLGQFLFNRAQQAEPGAGGRSSGAGAGGAPGLPAE